MWSVEFLKLELEVAEKLDNDKTLLPHLRPIIKDRIQEILDDIDKLNNQEKN